MFRRNRPAATASVSSEHRAVILQTFHVCFANAIVLFSSVCVLYK